MKAKLLAVCVSFLILIAMLPINSIEQEKSSGFVEKKLHDFAYDFYEKGPQSKALIIYIGGGYGNLYEPSYWNSTSQTKQILGSINSTGIEPDDGEKEFINWLVQNFTADLLYIKQYYIDGYDGGHFVIEILNELNRTYSEISLIGFSGGGVVVTLLIEKYNFTKAVIISAPIYWLPDEYYDRWYSQNIFRSAIHAWRVDTPTLLVYGKYDKIAPYKFSAMKFMEKAPDGLSMLVLYECGHSPFNDEESADKIKEDVSAFFRN